MHLSRLELTNFRSFATEVVDLEERLTVLVGENNGGKSNLIDAIRLLTRPLSGRREIYCEESDIRFDAKERSFSLQATFADLSPSQQGRLISAVTDTTLTKACFGLAYEASGKSNVYRPSLWAGQFKAPPEAGAHETIRHVYLPPLRDAKRALASGNPTRIYALLRHFLGEADPDDIAKNLARNKQEEILGKVDKAVGLKLGDLTEGVRPQGASLGFNASERLIDIARDLRFKLADHGIKPEELQYSGHGFANLLYMATIAVELEKTDTSELTIFLVEEPEAHLHPQLQAAVLSFLEERSDESRQDKPDKFAPSGHLQVVVATHSPNLSAWVPNKNLVFVRSIPPEADAGQDNGEATKLGAEQAVPVPRRVSRCMPLSRLKLTDSERRKIDRYLDVTKSAMLFGGRILLVEGIAEALLLPAIAKHHVLKNNPEGMRRFRSAAFVPIDGIDFEPYVKALLTQYEGVRIADRLVVITDGDKQTVEAGKPHPGEQRKKKLETLAAVEGADLILEVFVSTYSLETELVASGNEKYLKTAYTELHKKSEQKWDDAVAKDGDERAEAIQELFKNTAKGDFAQLVADQIGPDEPFVVPDYLWKAIEALVE